MSDLRAYGWVLAAYVVATVAAVYVGGALHPDYPLWASVLIADVAGTLVMFGFSRAFNNSSFYDPYWSVGPIVIAVVLMLGLDSDAPVVRQVAVLLLVGAWGVRLTFNWCRGWRGLGHEDWRYVNLRKTMGPAYWPVSLLGLHLFPTVLVYLGCLAMLPAVVTGTRGIGVLDVGAIAVMAAAIYLEARADRELHAFVRGNPAPTAILKTGLWSRCRHPNYLGEVLLWWGLALFGVAADPSAWWVFAGPVAITALFVFISIPMIDKRMLAKRPGYAEWKRHVPALLPLGRRS